MYIIKVYKWFENFWFLTVFSPEIPEKLRQLFTTRIVFGMGLDATEMVRNIFMLE